jgi:hypothetical protein
MGGRIIEPDPYAQRGASPLPANKLPARGRTHGFVPTGYVLPVQRQHIRNGFAPINYVPPV